MNHWHAKEDQNPIARWICGMNEMEGGYYYRNWETDASPSMEDQALMFLEAQYRVTKWTSQK